MDQCHCRGKLLKNFQDHWSIQISPGNSYGPMTGPYEFPPKLVWTNAFVAISFGSEQKRPGANRPPEICPRKSTPKRGLWESYFFQGIIGKTHTQNLQILREDTLGATCSAGPFCLLPKVAQGLLEGTCAHGIRRGRSIHRVYLSPEFEYTPWKMA